MVHAVDTSITCCSLREQLVLCSSMAFKSGTEEREPDMHCSDTRSSHLIKEMTRCKSCLWVPGIREFALGAAYGSSKVSQSGGLSPSARAMLGNLLPKDPTCCLLKKSLSLEEERNTLKRYVCMLWGGTRPPGFFG